ncbi:cyclin domain containing protein [Moelleriella libera RCEF 2490]|uniref:Cyclin domain containing protein n=1 Tax=Moelleriella libera RCEF 2490 TaxID=1081109 RepID=A0A166NLC8_9HYPO|nr:cyclin domain containing protein [Moelleriella libera RCEF 2490]
MAFHYADQTFFIDSDEPSRARIDALMCAKSMSMIRQDAISSNLSRLAADDYLEDIVQHTRQMEACSELSEDVSQHALTWPQDETMPDATLIDMQREIQWFMRPYLIDFLVEAHAAFGLLQETLFLAINLLDRYCSRRVVYKQHYQLVGCAALLIAAKYGDKKDLVPQINELNNMCCGLYDAGMFTQMEMHVLNTLEWTIGHPTVDFFLQLRAIEEGDDKDVKQMASYLSEIALYHRDFVSTRPSTIAQSSLTLARAILGRPEAIEGACDLDEDLTLLTLSQHLRQPSATLARKYSTPNMYRVSEKLAVFIAEQDAMAARSMNGLMRPTSVPSKQCDIYSTPQKGHGASGGFEGYLTPPITPDGSGFAVAPNMAKDAYPLPPRCPVTPTPQQHHNGYLGIPPSQHHPYRPHQQ